MASGGSRNPGEARLFIDDFKEVNIGKNEFNIWCPLLHGRVGEPEIQVVKVAQPSSVPLITAPQWA